MKYKQQICSSHTESRSKRLQIRRKLLKRLRGVWKVVPTYSYLKTFYGICQVPISQWRCPLIKLPPTLRSSKHPLYPLLKGPPEACGSEFEAWPRHLTNACEATLGLWPSPPSWTKMEYLSCRRGPCLIRWALQLNNEIRREMLHIHKLSTSEYKRFWKKFFPRRERPEWMKEVVKNICAQTFSLEIFC